MAMAIEDYNLRLLREQEHRRMQEMANRQANDHARALQQAGAGLAGALGGQPFRTQERHGIGFGQIRDNTITNARMNPNTLMPEYAPNERVMSKPKQRKSEDITVILQDEVDEWLKI